LKIEELYWVNLAEKHLRDPHDSTLPLKVYPSQRHVIHFFQFGTKIGDPPEMATEAAIVKCRRGSGKTTSSCIAATMAACEDPGVSIGLFATTEDRAKDMLDLIKYFIETSPKYSVLKPKSKSMIWTKNRIQLRNRSDIRVYTTSHAIRGPHHEYGIIDEAAQMNDEIILADILPKFSVIGKRWVMLSTPYGMRGVFYKFWNLAETQMMRGEKPQFTLIELDAVEDGRQSADKLQKYMKLSSITGDVWGVQEYGAEFIERGNMVFPEKWIEDAMTKYMPIYENSWNNVAPGTKYCVAIDFGGGHSRTSIAVGHRSGDFKILDYMETFEPPAEGKFTKTRNRLFAIMRHFPTYMLVPDCTGIGEPNMEEVKKYIMEHRMNVKILSNKKNKLGIYFDRQTKTNLIEGLQEDFESATLVLPYHFNAIYPTDKGWEMQELKRELMTFRSEKRSSGVIIYGTQAGFDDRVIALALLCYGLSLTYPHKIIIRMA